jgi:hypothetical protein
VSLALQYLLVALIVLPCAVYAAGVLSPPLKRRALRGTALWLLRPGRSQNLRQWGLKLMPPEQAKGCGAGCSDCNNCAPPAGAEQPLLDLRLRR